MFRIIFLIASIVGSGLLFVVYTKPLYNTVQKSREELAAYETSLASAKKLRIAKDELTNRYNSVSAEDRERLRKLMPDNVDNIRLIIDIQKIASKYGMLPKDIKFDAKGKEATPTGGVNTQFNQGAGKEYGTFEMDFSVTGTYANFLAFSRDLEKSLRLVDIVSVGFSSTEQPGSVYKYTYKIRTYWLKN